MFMLAIGKVTITLQVTFNWEIFIAVFFDKGLISIFDPLGIA